MGKAFEQLRLNLRLKKHGLRPVERSEPAPKQGPTLNGVLRQARLETRPGPAEARRGVRGGGPVGADNAAAGAVGHAVHRARPW